MYTRILIVYYHYEKNAYQGIVNDDYVNSFLHQRITNLILSFQVTKIKWPDLRSFYAYVANNINNLITFFNFLLLSMLFFYTDSS